jgi:lipoprotein
MKKNILVILSILIITILSGCQKKEEVSTYEQDRVAQYILDNVELVDGHEIKKIKFLSFEKPNTAAQTWSIDIEINDNIAMNLSENKLGDKLSIIYSDKEVKYISKERERRKIEIIYLKDGKHGR